MRLQRYVLLTLVLPAALGLAAAAVAQEQQLDQVGDSVTLDRPDGQAVVIDSGDLPPAPPRPQGLTYQRELTILRDRYGRAVADLEAALGERIRGKGLDNPQWRQRVDQACLDLDAVSIEIRTLEPPAPFAEVHSKALEAAQEYSAVAELVRSVVPRSVYGLEERTAHLIAGRAAIDRVLELAALVQSGLEQTSPPAPLVVYDAYAAADELCASRWPAGGKSLQSCVEKQRAAIQALAARNQFAVGIEAAAFNTLRNRCALQWPDDFEQRDACERQALAALPQP